MGREAAGKRKTIPLSCLEHRRITASCTPLSPVPQLKKPSLLPKRQENTGQTPINSLFYYEIKQQPLSSCRFCQEISCSPKEKLGSSAANSGSRQEKSFRAGENNQGARKNEREVRQNDRGAVKNP
jgi:hypothetical protein